MNADLELLVRRARMRQARADPHRSTTEAIAAMEAGAGAELVARSERARMILEERLKRRRSTEVADTPGRSDRPL